MEEVEMFKTEKVLLELKDAVAVITLNRPEKSNAFDGDVWLGLEEAARQIKFNPGVKAAVLAGAGRAFCGGLDIKAALSEGVSLGDRTLRDGFETLQYLSGIFTLYETLPVPVIAAVNGGCIGVGMELALACDIRIASQQALFSIPEVVYGIIADCGGTQRLPRIVGPGMAKELVLTGRRIDASEALRIGLVNHVYPEETLMEEAFKMAQEIVALPETAVQASKRALNAAMNSAMGMGLYYETATAETVLGERLNSIIIKNKVDY
jgi:enoyl-CoA hydratase